MHLGQLSSLVAVTLLAGMHALAGALNAKMTDSTRGYFLAAAAGCSTAYVFMMLFPELADFQAAYLKAHPHRLLPWLHEQVFLLALLGFLILFWLKRWATQKEIRSPKNKTSFLVTIGCSALINAVIGYTLAELGNRRGLAMALSSVAYGAHLLVDDSRQRLRWADSFRSIGRWILIVALFFGWVLRAGSLGNGHVLSVGYALLSGNIMSESLPNPESKDRLARYGTFLMSAVAFTALVLIAYRLEQT